MYIDIIHVIILEFSYILAESIDIQALNYISTDTISQLLSKYLLNLNIMSCNGGKKDK